ncbi:hypothetical protein MKX03_002098 [Papaver bracteatum]|nr:hypothetical protein MKX03_002098 [Papaver bracteatum]
MDKENEKINNHQEVKGTENLNNHLSLTDNSMEMKPQVSSDSSAISKVDEVSDTSKVIVCANRYGKTPASDNYIMRNILSRLRSKHLTRFKAVCTQWKSMIETDSYLIDLQYRRHKVGNKPILYVMSPLPPKPDEPVRVGGTIEFAGNRPIEVQRLELDRSNFGIPKQTVAGLVCITAGKEAFLIYNPSTGERTPWIETPNVNENIGGERRRDVHCIAFGYSPRTKEHKVLCISTIKKKGVVRALNVYFPSSPGCTEEDRVFCLQKHEDGEENPLFDHPDGFEEVGADEEQVCEVFTVGENTWRRIDAVPPYSLLSKVCYLGDLDHYNEESKSVYVKGKIYWRFRFTRKGEVLMVFDVRTEKFLVIPIPGYVTETPWKYPQTVELLEVHGHIAVLNFTPGCPFSLWILDQHGSNKWSYEKLRIPCNWNGLRNLSIEAVPGPSGTKFIILKLQTSEDIYFYDCDKSGIFNIQTFDELHGHEGLNYQPGELREILALVDSLTPVCTKPCRMF